MKRLIFLFITVLIIEADADAQRKLLKKFIGLTKRNWLFATAIIKKHPIAMTRRFRFIVHLQKMHLSLLKSIISI